MKKTVFTMTLGALLLLGGGCDIPWRTIGTIAAASSNGDYSALVASGTEWLDDRDDDDSEAWYCWPACSWFD